MSRFWIILSIVIVGIVGLIIITKPKDSTVTFNGNAAEVQSDDHIAGNAKAKVTLIEYADFQCPSCANVYPMLKEIKAEYGDRVQFVFRHFPIISIHPNAFAAARAAEAAGNQGKFWEMHDTLFENQSLWGQISTNQQSTFEGYAEGLGLNIEKFKTDYESETTGNRINRDISSATQFNVAGTPTFILNGEKIENPGSKEGFAAILDNALKQNK